MTARRLLLSLFSLALRRLPMIDTVTATRNRTFIFCRQDACDAVRNRLAAATGRSLDDLGFRRDFVNASGTIFLLATFDATDLEVLALRAELDPEGPANVLGADGYRVIHPVVDREEELTSEQKAAGLRQVVVIRAGQPLPAQPIDWDGLQGLAVRLTPERALEAQGVTEVVHGL